MEQTQHPDYKKAQLEYEHLSQKHSMPTSSQMPATMILNHALQVIYVSQAVLNMFEFADDTYVLGQRPGYFMCCQNATPETMCTTTPFCSTCGLYNTITKARQLNKYVTGQCTITQGTHAKLESAIELEISVIPHTIDSKQYFFVNIKDISPQKRLRMLEKVFFHDIINTAGAIASIVDLFKENVTAETIEYYLPNLNSAVNQLVDEILSQKDILSAENDDLLVHPDKCSSSLVVEDVVNLYHNMMQTKNQSVEIDKDSQNVDFISDATLLKRILGNMLKNAIESSDKGTTIKIGYSIRDGQVLFWVKNHCVLDENLKLQIFKRSFSTKSPNRGLGTYSMKLFATKYLQGQVWFKSDQENGTTFFVQIPAALS